MNRPCLNLEFCGSTRVPVSYLDRTGGFCPACEMLGEEYRMVDYGTCEYCPFDNGLRRVQGSDGLKLCVECFVEKQEEDEMIPVPFTRIESSVVRREPRIE